MPIVSSLVGQEDSVKLLNQILPDPPHIFISGGYGCGKTTIVSEFLKEYYIQKNPDKKIPFVMNYITYKRGTDILEESQQFQLCVSSLFKFKTSKFYGLRRSKRFQNLSRQNPSKFQKMQLTVCRRCSLLDICPTFPATCGKSC